MHILNQRHLLKEIEHLRKEVESFSSPPVGYELLSLFHGFLKEAGVESIELTPRETSSLYIKNEENVPINLWVKPDQVLSIGGKVLYEHKYDMESINFFNKLIRETRGEVTVIDIGANWGLFSRQVIHFNKVNINKIFCYEPDPGNFKILIKNLSSLNNIRFRNMGLGSKDENRILYREASNDGNYSLLRDAMRDNEYDQIHITIINALNELESWMKTNTKIFWKSDTQGHDEAIVTSLPLDFWEGNVMGGVIELWRLKGKDFNANKFKDFLECFPFKILSPFSNKNLSSEEVMDFIIGPGSEYDARNLYFSKYFE